MKVNTEATGICCKWVGAWLLATAVLLYYGETAPSVASPDFRWAVLSLFAGGSLFGFGCGCRIRAGKTRG